MSILINCQRRSSKITKTMSSIEVFSILLIITTTLILTIRQEVDASGVFELELLKLEQLDLKSTTASTTINSNNKNNSTKNYNELQNEDSKSVIRILVCLKEAFTSQLDGPCTFGNASLTLDRDSISSKSEQTLNSTKHHQGSQLTNLVRILFTFRWTKSFTIILTAEQLQIDALNHHTSNQQNRHWSGSILQAGGSSKNDNNSFVVDSSVAWNKKPLKELTNQEQSQNTSIISNGSVVVQNFIDRHVLTENEVLPNLEQNSNKPWAIRYSRSLKSSLEYKFRVYCSLNYYGDGCTTFCRARDDQFGHYNCSSTGQKVCLDGWEGSDCDKAKCRSGCNQLHGYCDKPNTCECRPGWTGSRCDECLTYPGCQNGYCLTSWQCICQQNWGGVLCDQDLNYCGSHEPCKNNGTCQNIAPGKYKCHCPAGLTGVDCGLNLSLLPGGGTLTQISPGCPLNPCLNGGTCIGINEIKALHERKVHDNISTDFLSSYDFDAVMGSDITSESETLENNRHYRCQCPPEWSGDYCQWSTDLLEPTNSEILNYVAPTTTGSYIDTTVGVVPSMNNLQNNINGNNKTNESPIEDKYIAYIENNHVTSNAPQHVEMRNLISWVVIATIIGVFISCLLIVWCCLIAIESNKFSCIQMNIIRAGNCESQSQEAFSSRLRRVHEKIRDSFRRSSAARIKPETKYSIENVLKPPPSYEESSNYYVNKINLESTTAILSDITKSTSDKIQSTNENLVMYQEEELAKKIKAPTISVDAISTNINCPRHGHLYRQKHLDFNNYHQQHIDQCNQIWTDRESTYVTIEGKNSKRYTHSQNH